MCISKPLTKSKHAVNVAFICCRYSNKFMRIIHMVTAFWLCFRHCVLHSSMRSVTTMTSRCRSLQRCRVLHVENECMPICVKDRFSFVNWLVRLISPSTCFPDDVNSSWFYPRNFLTKNYGVSNLPCYYNIHRTFERIFRSTYSASFGMLFFFAEFDEILMRYHVWCEGDCILHWEIRYWLLR